MYNNFILYILYKLIFTNILFNIIISNGNINNKANTYLIFPLEYLANKNYKFIKDNNLHIISPEEIIQQIYYKNLLTKISIGSPSQNSSFLIETNSDKFYLSSINPSIKSKEKGKESIFYQFYKKDFYNELLSSTYINSTCELLSHLFFPYSEICQSIDIITFNRNNSYIEKEFPFKLVRNIDENIPGYIGLIYNNYNYDYTRNFLMELKESQLIDNYYWFFNFDEFNPLEKKLKGQFIIGGLPHVIFPNKYSIDNFETTSSSDAKFAASGWRLNINKIYIDNYNDKYIQLNNKIMTFQYEIYNIIANMEFLFEIKYLFMDELINEKKCFYSNFSQNLYNNYNLTFYYCNKSIKNILYEKMPYIKFASNELNYIFELTKEELFYEKGDYIYFMILFCEFESNTYWITGQIFTSKYNFVFDANKKQIGFYKNSKNKEEKNDNKKEKGSKNKRNNILIIIIIGLCIILFFTFIGLFLGKKFMAIEEKLLLMN